MHMNIPSTVSPYQPYTYALIYCIYLSSISTHFCALIAQYISMCTVCIYRIQMITDAHSENRPEHFPPWKTAQVQTLFIVLVMIRGTSDFSLFWRLTSHANDHPKSTQHYKWRTFLVCDTIYASAADLNTILDKQHIYLLPQGKIEFL